MKRLFFLGLIFTIISCASDDAQNTEDPQTQDQDPTFDFSSVLDIDFDNLFNYSEQLIPVYITKDNTPASNMINDEVATLGRVLFYDKNLSVNNTIACASCHKQDLAFGDDNSQSIGVDGVTGRHSMRLINSRFSNENKFFWDERANSLEIQTTMPIQDHIEMGFSGENGDLGFEDLIAKLQTTEYYPDLFNFAFGNTEINETKVQNALAQFIRSIQSFDSKFDEGRAQVPNDGQPFPNYTTEENQGKQLFLQAPNFNNLGSRISGGVGCAGCHQAPEFDIDPNSLNNGNIGNANGIGTDFTITRSPSLRDVVKIDGTANGQFMHIGASSNLATVLNHYNNINTIANPNLDPRLRPSGIGQQLNMTQEEMNAVIAFIRTLGGTNVYTDEKWSNPFIN
ncbi:cytochrome-c peroxidase [Lacinutrix jangbogonensis]|uniref:cytochrome-c peroxidase n=1 Tax=Lacinutrix jangbogonensis TaxID=1469557 RepID=UPI00053D1A56|nr:cytochrome-c peroxidase [Lacinutrix jangbogonensis]